MTVSLQHKPIAEYLTTHCCTVYILHLIYVDRQVK